MFKKIKKLWLKIKNKGVRKVKLSAMAAQFGGKEFEVESIKTGNKMLVTGKTFSGGFTVKMLTGEKQGQILTVEDSERYKLVDDGKAKRKVELRGTISNLSLKVQELEKQIKAAEGELDKLENAG